MKRFLYPWIVSLCVAAASQSQPTRIAPYDDEPPHDYGTVSTPPTNYDVFAFPSYDSDTGIGAGAKAFFLNYAGWNESFDVTAYASAKNERWVRFVFSVPDFETRQGKVYPLAMDLVADYDKYLRANFFPGHANGNDEGMETFIREPIELSFSLSRGFSSQFSASAMLLFKSVSNFNFMPGSAIDATGVAADHGQSSLASAGLRVRYDSRDSYINPREGLVLQCDLEKGVLSSEDTRTTAVRGGAIIQWYTELFSASTIGAFRASVQSLAESRAPLWMQYSLGGTNSLRGFPMDRFIGNAMALANAEVRFPLYKSLGGVLFADGGMTAGSLHDLSGSVLHTDTGAGLRLHFDTFVVRADLGMSAEGTGLYINFSHLF